MSTVNRSNYRASVLGFRRVMIGGLALLFVGGLAAGSARADFYAYFQEDGGALSAATFSTPGVDDPVFNPGTVVFTAAFGAIAPDFSIDVTSKDIGSTGLVGQVNTTQIDVTKTGAGSHTLTVYVVNNDFTFPVGSPLLLASDLAASANPTDGDLELISGIDTPAAAPYPAPAFPPTDSVPVVKVIGGPGETTGSKVVGRVAGLFSLVQVISATMTGAETATFSSTTTIRNVPEPGAVVGLVSLVGMMGVGLLFRRRQSRA